MRWQKLAVMAVAFAALLPAATPCSADEDEGVPFTDYGTGRVTNVVQPNPPALTFDQSYELTSMAPVSPLGPLSQIVGSQTLKFEAGPLPGQVGARGVLRGGETTITRADGATLQGKYSGSFVRVPGSFVAGPVAGGPSFVVLTADIKYGHGTGGLKGVTGTARFVVLATVPTPTPGPSFSYTLAGTLEFPDRPGE